MELSSFPQLSQFPVGCFSILQICRLIYSIIYNFLKKPNQALPSLTFCWLAEVIYRHQVKQRLQSNFSNHNANKIEYKYKEYVHVHTFHTHLVVFPCWLLLSQSNYFHHWILKPLQLSTCGMCWGPTLQFTGLKGSPSNILVPITTAHIQRSCSVYAFMDQSCFGSTVHEAKEYKAGGFNVITDQSISIWFCP